MSEEEYKQEVEYYVRKRVSMWNSDAVKISKLFTNLKKHIPAAVEDSMQKRQDVMTQQNKDEELESILHLNGCQQHVAGWNEAKAGGEMDTERMEELEDLTLEEVQLFISTHYISKAEVKEALKLEEGEMHQIPCPDFRPGCLVLHQEFGMTKDVHDRNEVKKKLLHTLGLNEEGGSDGSK